MQLQLTADNAKATPSSELVGEFTRVFAKESPEALRWAFEAWRLKSGFFPAISDIRELVAEWKRGEREQQEIRERLREKIEIGEAEKAGLLVPFDEIKAQLAAIAEHCRMPEPARTSKIKLLMQARGLAGTPPALKLTPEQIEARRPQERAEIERYRRAVDGEEKSS